MDLNIEKRKIIEQVIEFNLLFYLVFLDQQVSHLLFLDNPFIGIFRIY